MSPVPCFIDTCSVDLSYSPVTGLQADSKLHDLGAVECRDSGLEEGEQGLWVRVHGDPAAIDPAGIDACDSLLGRTTDNDLFARRPDFARRVLSSGGTQGIPNAGGTETVPLGTFTNTTACELLMVARLKCQLNYAVTAAGGSVEDRTFMTDFTFNLRRDTVSVEAFSENINGVSGASLTDDRILVWYAPFVHVLPVGASVWDVLVTRSLATAGQYGTDIDTNGAPQGVILSLEAAFLELDERAGMVTI